MVADQAMMTEADVSPRVAAVGFGCRRGCQADELLELLWVTLRTVSDKVQPCGLFSIAAKRDEAGLREAARRLVLPLTFFEIDALQTVAARCLTTSARSLDMFGVPSVAEAAALAGAGLDATLLGARRASPRATCAIAARRLT